VDSDCHFGDFLQRFERSGQQTQVAAEHLPLSFDSLMPWGEFGDSTGPES